MVLLGQHQLNAAVPNHRCSQARLCCLMHSALLITLINCMKPYPPMEARGGGAGGNGLCPPAQPGGGAARPELPPAQPSLLIRCPPVRGRATTPRGSQAPAAMRCPLLWAGWLLAAGCLVGATGSCRHRCCPGRNNTCWAPAARRARCYCDSYCQRTGDCCQDYLAMCRRAAVGCAVGPWGPWSVCSSRCGVGSRARRRQVTVPPRHGGDPCPDLKQRRGCLGQHPTCGTAEGNVGCLLPSCVLIPVCCRPGVASVIPVPLTAALLPEVAKILPNSFFSQDFRDPWRRAGLLLPEEPSGQAWSRRLHRDKQVCVECWGNLSHHRPHCTGHGLQGARTFWVAASVVGCQGSWVQEGLQEGCICSPPALIFV
ncbi:somatomedin-B and thrombospondin type-1 domain-containing protein-like isoform X2 [Cinclus cinclus]|uniref:somatomedin-B and thrombospondin type-1 domain-containing protein-like isoform X2 n=1 Tax=Cinclus cinclus TaxID=127875 RepID=UPI002E0FCA41